MATPPDHHFDKETWRGLMAAALRVVDSLVDNGYGILDFRVGGGTVLMFRFDHRVSKDIDIFTHDAQALSYLSPRLNDVAERESRAYLEQANVVKLLLRDGDIDFIVAAPVILGAPCETMDFRGRAVTLDATAEILAKKLMYRADSFKARDVFDMVTTLSLDPESAAAALRATARTRPALMRRLAAMADLQDDELTKDLVLTDSGRPHAAGMVARLMRAIDAVDQGA